MFIFEVLDIFCSEATESFQHKQPNTCEEENEIFIETLKQLSLLIYTDNTDMVKADK